MPSARSRRLLLEQDYTAVGARLAELRAAGVVDLGGYLESNFEELQGLVSRIQVVRANEKALEMMGAGSFGELVIEAGEGDEETVLTVIDDGPGVDQPKWETIFERCERAHEPTTQPASIGLGLTVSRLLARMMGGGSHLPARRSGQCLLAGTPDRNCRFAGR